MAAALGFPGGSSKGFKPSPLSLLDPLVSYPLLYFFFYEEVQMVSSGSAKGFKVVRRGSRVRGDPLLAKQRLSGRGANA